MTEHWIIYRDVAEFPRKQFERIDAPKPGEKVIKDQVFPAAHGFAAMYIKRHHIHIGEAVVNLITYTEVELSVDEAIAIAKSALTDLDIDFLEQE